MYANEPMNSATVFHDFIIIYYVVFHAGSFSKLLPCSVSSAVMVYNSRCCLQWQSALLDHPTSDSEGDVIFA